MAFCCKGRLENKRIEKKLLLIGLDNSGKTTMLTYMREQTTDSKIKKGEAQLVMNTPFINVEVLNLPGEDEACIVYDMSGQGRYRDSWSFFYPDVDGIFFVIDSADHERLPVVQEVLQELVRHPGLARRSIPLVILANKQDAKPNNKYSEDYDPLVSI